MLGEGADAVRVIEVWGSPYEIGYAHGYLVRDELKDYYAAFFGVIKGEMGVSDKQLDDAWEVMSRHIADEFKEEMRGLAAGTGDIRRRAPSGKASRNRRPGIGADAREQSDLGGRRRLPLASAHAGSAPRFPQPAARYLRLHLAGCNLLPRTRARPTGAAPGCPMPARTRARLILASASPA